MGVRLTSEWLKKIKDEGERALIDSFVNSLKAKNLDELRIMLNNEINKCREWLAVNRHYSTINRKRREYTKRLEQLVRLQEGINKRGV